MAYAKGTLKRENKYNWDLRLEKEYNNKKEESSV